MSVLKSYLTSAIRDFRGAWPLLEPSDVPQSNALRAENVEFIPGLVKTRLGFSSVESPGDSVAAMANWLAPSFNGIASYLAYLSTGGAHVGMNLMQLSNGVIGSLYAPGGSPVGASFAFGGYRLFMATFNANGLGSDQGRVYSNANILSFNSGTDKLFQPPVQTIPVITDTSVGIVTAGVHHIGYVLTTRNGFSTQPSPVGVGGNFSAAAHTALGGKQLLITITPSTPWDQSWLSYQIIMTIAGGTQFFFVPGATGNVPFGTTFPLIALINIDDGVLAADGTDATPFFDKLVQTQAGTGPINPFYIGEYNNHLYYLALDGLGVNTCYVSDTNDFQTIRQSTSPVYLPGQRPITTGFSLYNTLYLVGPHWTFSTQDSGGDPVTWPGPQLIDGAIGTLSPLGVTVNAAMGMAWVADVGGLYVFQGGAYSTRPISYYQTPDWKRINWASGFARVQLADNKDRKQISVIAPLDGATVPNFILTWDYTRGVDPESVNYSINSITDFSPSAIAIVQNSATNRIETWLGPASSGNSILRQNDGTEAQPYADILTATSTGVAINSLYQTALLAPLNGIIYRHSADQIRIQGEGTTTITALSLDGSTQTSGQPQLDEGFPGEMFIQRYDILNESCFLQFQTTDVNAWFQLSEIVHYYSAFVMQR